MYIYINAIYPSLTFKLPSKIVADEGQLFLPVPLPPLPLKLTFRMLWANSADEKIDDVLIIFLRK